MLNSFALNAREKDTGKIISKFALNLDIIISHYDEELAGLDIDSLRLYYLNEVDKQWVPLSTEIYDSQESKLDTPAGEQIISDVPTIFTKVTTNHFSQYGEQANPLQVGPGRVMAAQVNLSSGAATYNYPIELPPGPGGFQPKVELNYSSGSVDEMKNKQSVGSWVGIGWDLYLGRISYDVAGDLSSRLSEGSSELCTTNGNNYFTNPDQKLKITRTGNTWEIWDTDGTYYRFGGTNDSIQFVYNGQSTQYYRWDLNLMR